MIISPEDKAILYQTYLKVARSDANLTDIFYKHLFEANPTFKMLFPSDMQRQGIKFRLMLNTIVLGVDNLSVLRTRLQHLGRFHGGYHLSKQDYRNFLDAFVWTLQSQIGADFTPVVEGAWRRILALVVEYMLDGTQ